ncbi:STAS domain-containing protein [Limnochorda pilosa]|uniref:Anti-sigma factor antagonist n=1 Tax=Limnochorda pilosa TaxID=1555112 RepID=A0A0K2SKK8_LIMPI|nr:STAS domain-containing protein [Limnochorda pilosa]BAS27552.1 anti-sigma F factor antagonist [Limnochorda pilosa]
MAGIPSEASSRLEVHRYGRGSCDVLRLEGELDLSSVAKVRAALPGEGPARAGRRHLVLDLRRLRFMDSSGLGVFFELYRIIAARGGQTRVAGPQPPVERVLRLAGFLRLAGRADSVHEALRSLEGDGPWTPGRPE